MAKVKLTYENGHENIIEVKSAYKFDKTVDTINKNTDNKVIRWIEVV